MGQSAFEEVAKECPASFGSDGESPKVIAEKEERGREGGTTDGAGDLFSCRIGHLGRRWYSLPHR